MARKSDIYSVLEVAILVCLTTSSDLCDEVSIGSQKDCLPDWRRCMTAQNHQAGRYQYKPPLKCTALYETKLSRCFHPPDHNPEGTSDLRVPLVADVGLSGIKVSGQTKPILNVKIPHPNRDNNVVMQLHMRSTREISDELYVDPYYEKFHVWKQIKFTRPGPKHHGIKATNFNVTFGNLDTCNVYCLEGSKCLVNPNLYLLTISVFVWSESENLPGQSITYQVTTHNRRFLPDAKETDWRPAIMMAILPSRQGIHVVFEPLPSRYVGYHTYYEVILQDWETWEATRDKIVYHNQFQKGAFYGCTFDSNVPKGRYEIMILYKNCTNCQTFQKWAKSADFLLLENNIPTETRSPRFRTPQTSHYTVAAILGATAAVIFLTAIVFFCRKITKARRKRHRGLSEDVLHRRNNERIDSSIMLEQRTQSEYSIATKLQNFCYPDGVIDDMNSDDINPVQSL
ncbi:uncharacterized protein [Argopecten irradians]|uniref:uncharacterized protein n=1 Tax=Argopecten irradians TaxID=31199 RepID=UPI003722AB8E